MYITYYSNRSTTPLSPARVLVDSLFDGEDLDTNIVLEEPTLKLRTKTSKHTDINHYELPTRYKNKVDALTIKLQIFLEQHPNLDEMYHQFKIPKRSGGLRTIDAPNEELKTFMKEVLEMFKSFKVLTHDSAWAYVKGRDILGAMQEHTNNESKWYLKLDVKDFFGSCTEAFIIEQISKLYPFSVAISKGHLRTIDMLQALAKLAVKNGVLPQGTPMSPLITNLMMVEFDYLINQQLAVLAKERLIYLQRYVYTRYADDIIISGKVGFDFQIVKAAVENIFLPTPLRLKEEKTRYGSNAGRNWNLGLMCNKDNEITIGYRKKHQLKSIINNYLLDGNWATEDLQWLQGQLAWLRNIEPDYFDGLMTYLENKTGIKVWDKVLTDLKLKA